MKIVFMGTPEFAIPSLKAIAATGHRLVAVVTNTDEPQGRGLKVTPPPVKIAAAEIGVPVIQVSSLRDPEFADRLRSLEPDVIVVVAFRILPKEIFTIAKKGTFNLHASLLPKYRGAAPINWAIVKGERETGVTTFFLDEKIDTGKIILQRRTEIGTDDTAGELADRLSKIGADAVVDTLDLIERNQVSIIEQDDAKATKAPKISKENCLIDWSKPAEDVHNFIRGFSPEPGAFTYLQNRMAKIIRARIAERPAHGAVGELQTDSGKLNVVCGDGAVEILEIQMEGKKKLRSVEFLRGARITPATVFSNKR
ncbi:MAG TPA: methionyl-tRNA formyltransferase [Candidatus Kryptonia bacterium]